MVLSVIITFRHFAKAIKRTWKDREFRAIAYFVVLLLIVGTFFYHNVEGFSYLDSFYFSVITLSTVGYGDLAPVTALGKLFTVVYILIGLGILVSFVGKIAQSAINDKVTRDEKKADYKRKKNLIVNVVKK